MSRQFREAMRSALDGFAKVFGAEVKRLMMDWHDEASAGFIGHLHRLFWRVNETRDRKRRSA